MLNNYINDAIAKYKTPFYIFDKDVINNQIIKIRDSLDKKISICYAMKANPFIVKAINNNVDYFEVCSPGEFSICERANLPINKIVMSGVYKNEDDIEYAIKTYKESITYTIESLNQLIIINKYAIKYNVTIRVLLRLTVGNQFGMDETTIRDIIENRNEYLNIVFDGIQFFSGTQKKSIERIKKEIIMLDQFCDNLSVFNFKVKKLEYGPGLPVCYFKEEENIEDSILSLFASEINKLSQKYSITLEMGRFISGSCGYYLTKVVDIKQNNEENICLVNGGIHHINYYGQMLAMKKPSIIHIPSKKGEVKNWNIYGSLCTTNDVLVKNYEIEELSIGDILLFEKVGAYSMTEGISLFLSRDLPIVLTYSKEEGIILVRDKFATNKLNY